MKQVSYASTLQNGDKVYVWNGDVRMTSKVTEVNGRTVRTGYGEFGRKTGKACGWAKLANVAGSRSYYLANAAGEKMVTAEGILRFNHNSGQYTAELDSERLLIVDADRLNYCLHYDDQLDKQVYQADTWLPFLDGDTVYIVEKDQ